MGRSEWIREKESGREREARKKEEENERSIDKSQLATKYINSLLYFWEAHLKENLCYEAQKHFVPPCTATVPDVMLHTVLSVIPTNTHWMKQCFTKI